MYILTPLIIMMMMFCSTIMSMLLLINNYSIFIEWEIININSTPIFFSMIFDLYGMIFISTILFISFNVLIFSNQYMINDLFLNRFTKLVCLFILSMNMLILFPHFMILMIGWDGLGVSSFLLIIYFQNSSSLSAGMLTMLINRIGDVFLILSISMTLLSGHWNIMSMWNSSNSLMIMFFILIAGMTKSAQIPFSSWLPAAMEAPTPVSALVHSSTLVTAGIFLLFRFYPFLSQFLIFNKILLIFSTLTMLMASMSASTQFDMKKIIALSTLSQLGLMMMSLAMFSPLFCFFHLITHAMFKALLFICAGTVIFYVNHSQDIRSISNLNKIMPLTCSSMLIANLALCGIPFLAGFFSKDLILEESFIKNTNMIFFVIILFSTGLTANYSFRMMKMLMWSPQLFFPFKNFMNLNMNFIFPMILMSFFAISSGALMNWILLPPTYMFLPMMMKLMIPSIIFLGSIFPFMSSFFFKSSNLFFLYSLSSMWFLTPLSNQNFIKPSMNISIQIFSSVDQGWLENFLNNFFFTKFLFSMYFSSHLNIINKLMMMIFLIIIPLFLLY
uniref:NADH-ubiquinone oxidoreductase chain 5 n=1 Tax=Spirobrachia sp. YL-2014 TaxID=1535021 RepID=A0A0E3DR22_9ANNE|nr:NADH dehydrogenase subunit 5 [Spirobrachia sp. YL-2014]